MHALPARFERLWCEQTCDAVRPLNPMVGYLPVRMIETSIADDQIERPHPALGGQTQAVAVEAGGHTAKKGKPIASRCAIGWTAIAK